MTPVREALEPTNLILLAKVLRSRKRYNTAHDIERAADALEQYAEALSAAPGEPCAWGRVIDGKAVTVSLTKTGANDEPLYTTPQPAAGWDDLLRKIEYATRKVSLTDHERIQSIRSLVCAEISKSEVRREAPAPAERRICEDDGSGEEIFNRQDLVPARPDTVEARLKEACRLALEFIESEMKYSQPAHDMGEEPSDRFTYDAVPVAMTLRQALSGGESEGAKLLPCPVCGGEAIHAIETLKRTIIKPDPSEPLVGRREEQLRIQALGAAISRRDWNAAERAYEIIRDKFDRPSEPSPPADRREIVARIIEPNKWELIDAARAKGLDKWASDLAEPSLAKADAILAALAQSDDASRKKEG